MKFEKRHGSIRFHQGPPTYGLALTQMSQMSVSVIGNMADILRNDSSYKQISNLRYLI